MLATLDVARLELEGGAELVERTELDTILLLLLEIALELDAAELVLPSIPQGAGKDAQLVRPTQLCEFSQPQPASLVTQIG